MTQLIEPVLPLIPVPPSRMSYEEFLEWSDGTHAEWVDGLVEFTHLCIDPMTKEVVVSVSREHSGINGFLIALFRFFVDFFALGEVHGEPYQMKTGPGLPGREPDVIFVSNANLHRLGEKYLNGPADLVVEIVSEESVRRDRVTKLAEYEAGGVREYWVLDPLKQEPLFYVLGEDGHYCQIPVGEDKIYRSTVLGGLWVKVDWFWQKPLPTLMGVIREWGLM